MSAARIPSQRRLLKVLLFLLLFPAVSAHAAQVTLAWDPNSDPGLAGYKIYYGTQSQHYSYYIDVGNQTSHTVTDLPGGATYYFAATAYNGGGLESGYSNEASFNAPVDCTYALSPSSQGFPASGGTGTIGVTTQGGCTWTASGGTWMTVTSGSSGTGNGTVSYSVSANTASSSRTTATSVAGQIFTVTQAGVQTYTLTASAGAGGTISPAGTTSVSSGSGQIYTITPGNGYTIGGVTVDGSPVGAVGSYTFTNVTANHTIAASFSQITYTLTVTKSGTGTGTVANSPSGTSFSAGTSVTLTAAPGANSTFAGWSGACAGTQSSCTVTLNNDVSVGAAFALNSYTISASAGAGGTISPVGTTSVSSGSGQIYTITPGNGYTISSVTVDGSPVGAVGSYTFTNVTANHTIAASFSQITYTLTASAGAGGTISPVGTTSVSSGSGQIYTITATTGYTIAGVTVDGGTVGTVGSYTFTNVTANHTIAASFSAVSGPVLAINTGGGTYTGSTTYLSDRYYSGGSTDSTRSSISGTPDSPLYQGWRRGTNFSYTMPVANGAYTVRLKFAEIAAKRPGARLFHVSLQGARVLNNFDIFASAGGQYKAYDVSFPATVTNGSLSVGFTGVKGNAVVNALEVIRN